MAANRASWSWVVAGVLACAGLGLGLSSCGGGISFSINDSRPPAVDVSAVAQADPGSPLAPHWQSGAFMEVYVRGYKDSNGDGTGDLRGLIQSLDYLRDLGVKGLWLMPVQRSQDHDHGYAVSDYRAIETDYGSLADFDELLQAAHARGIGVIIDYVVNHSAAQNPLFINASSAVDNPLRSWYVWQDPAPTGWSIFGNNPWNPTQNGAYLAQFSPSMPDFNLRNSATLAYHADSLRFWLNRGVDGFRFDAVAHLVENGPDAYMNQSENYAIVAQLRSVIQGYGQRYLVCEATSNATQWAQPQNCGSAFAFGHQQDIVGAARGDTAAIARMAAYFQRAPASMATMVSNHDLFAGERLWDQVGGNLAQYRLAAASYLLQPGTPFIYYGEELGMAGAAGLSGDAKLRTPMSWSADARNAGFSSASQPFRPLAANVANQNVAAELHDAQSLLAFYKAMLALRNTYPSIARGSYEGAFVNGSVLGFQRVLGSEKTLVLINYGSTEVNVPLSGLGAAQTMRGVYPKGQPQLTTDARGAAQTQLSAQSIQVFVTGV